MYEQEITRRHRTAFIIAVDRSQSMCEEIVSNGRKVSKAVAVSEITSRIVSELIMRARREDGIHDYYDIALIGYSGDDVRSIIDPERDFIPVAELCRYKPERIRISGERRLPNGETVLHTEEIPLWIPPAAAGDTPMYEAFLRIRDIAGEWCRDPRNADSFPPVVINITDGEASDCDSGELRDMAGQIKSLHTSDGNVLLINIHITSDTTARSLIFPTDDEIDDNNRYARLLADCSSLMPAPFDETIRMHRGNAGEPPFRGMSYNASITELITMLCIGSRSVTDML